MYNWVANGENRTSARKPHEYSTNIARFWYFGCGILIIGRASERSGAFEFLEKHHERDHMLDHYPEIMQGVQILE